ncbi:MAG: (d)CMP kinase [Dehalococcoidia bacterium]
MQGTDAEEKTSTTTQRPPSTIAIDGPGASGKSATGRLLARRLGYRFLDTGVMYRALTWFIIEQGISAQDEEAVGLVAQSVRMEVDTTPLPDDTPSPVSVNGRNATPFLARPDVEALVSLVSRLPAVREAMVAIQRREAGRAVGIVVAGRDIGTVLLPDADLKVYLDASPVEWARRRQEQAQQRGDATTQEDVLGDLARRDAIDSSREASPLRPADDAVILDTDGLSLEQVVERILAMTQ